VCTNCGLVQIERFIDDCVQYKDVDQYSVFEPAEEQVSKHMMDFAKEVNSTVFGGMVEDSSDLVKHCDKAGSKAEIAVEIYDTHSTGITAKTFCQALNINPTEFWKAMDKKGSSNKDRTFVMLKRHVYDCPQIDSKYEKEVIRVANRFREALLGAAEVQTVKVDRLLLGLMIIAACDVVQIKDINKSSLCKLYKLSGNTLKKHEALLQEVLKRNSKK
jgi:hypothetical protein